MANAAVLIREFANLLTNPHEPNKSTIFHVAFHTNLLSTASKNELLLALFNKSHPSSTKSSQKSEPEPQFHFFSSLPKELRLYIWSLALPPPRLIELEIVDNRSIPTSHVVDVPSLDAISADVDIPEDHESEADDIEEEIEIEDGDDDNDSDWFDLHDWHPNLRTRPTVTQPALLHVNSEARLLCLEHYAPLSTGGFIDYSRDAIYLSLGCTVNEPPPMWTLNYGSAFALLDCTLTNAELSKLRFLALESDVWDMEDGAGAAFVPNLRMVLVVRESEERKCNHHHHHHHHHYSPGMSSGSGASSGSSSPRAGEWEMRIPPGDWENWEERRMEGLPDSVICAELVRVGPVGYKAPKPEFEFQGFSEFIRGEQNERLRNWDGPRVWRRD